MEKINECYRTITLKIIPAELIGKIDEITSPRTQKLVDGQNAFEEQISQLIECIKKMQVDLREKGLAIHQIVMKHVQQVFQSSSMHEKDSNSSFLNSSIFASPNKSIALNKSGEEP